MAEMLDKELNFNIYTGTIKDMLKHCYSVCMSVFHFKIYLKIYT